MVPELNEHMSLLSAQIESQTHSHSQDCLGCLHSPTLTGSPLAASWTHV